MNLRLIRDLDNGICTLGTLLLNGVTLQTLERPWVPSATSPGGTKGVSCVPTGLYRLVRHDTEAHPRSFALVNEELGVYHLAVPSEKQGRTACLVHVGNMVAEIRGCIALGMDRGTDAIYQSRMAVTEFYSLVSWVDGVHTLEISI